MDRSHESTSVTSAELENIASEDVATLNTLVFRCHLYITHQVMMKPSLLSLVESKRPETRRCSVHKSDVSPFHKLVMTYARYRGRLHPAPVVARMENVRTKSCHQQSISRHVPHACQWRRSPSSRLQVRQASLFARFRKVPRAVGNLLCLSLKIGNNKSSTPRSQGRKEQQRR